MTSKELAMDMNYMNFSVENWLQEIAYQLAVMNEREASRIKAETVSPPSKRIRAR